MGASRTTFEKLQRDRAKKAKAAAKRAKRMGKVDPTLVTGGAADAPEVTAFDGEGPADVLDLPEDQELSASDLLAMVETIHKQFEDDEISFDEFEEKKAALFARISVD